MKANCDDYVARDEIGKHGTRGSSQGKINALLADLVEKEEELSLYKNRLKELEAAFYYNLELISERDTELGVLEKRLTAGNDQMEEVIRERNELDNLIKTMDEKHNKKIHQLETRLSMKEEEIRDLQKENLSNISTLKRIIDDVKQQQERKLAKMSAKFESQKNELVRGYREQIEEKEKYYLLEIDTLAGKLEQACRETDRLAYAEEEVKNLKSHLEDVEKDFLEKENRYLEQIRDVSKSSRKVSKEVQCKAQGSSKTVQTEPEGVERASEEDAPRREEHYRERIAFLQEQNEVLKLVIKDLKRNRECGGQGAGCECLTIRADIELVERRLEREMSNLKEVVEWELKGRAEEEAVIRSLETSVRCLKDKLLLELREKVQPASGHDICTYVYNQETHITLIEQRLCDRMDSLIAAAEEHRRKLNQQLEDVKKECFHRMDRLLATWEQPQKTNGEDLLQTIRLEIQKLENKIDNDLKNHLGNNCYNNALIGKKFRNGDLVVAGDYCRNDLSQEKWKYGAEPECGRPRKGLMGQTGVRKLRNNLVVGR